MPAWVYIECEICGEDIPVATEHESPPEALATHKRALHPEVTEGG